MNMKNVDNRLETLEIALEKENSVLGLALLRDIRYQLHTENKLSVPLMDDDPTNIVDFKVDRACRGECKKS